MRTALSRSAIAATAIGLLIPVAGVTTSASAATAAPGTDRVAAKTAAGWLGRQFVDGNHLQTDFGGTKYDDAGLTLDAVQAFAAAKVDDVRATRAMTWLANPTTLASYIGDGTTESYAGAHAKLALTLQIRGLNPAAYGGRNVIGELAGLQQPSGRFSDTSAFGDYSNAFGQSYGVIALHRAGRSTTKAIGYLAGQACTDGGVPIAFEQPTCTADPDATALAAQAFAAAGKTVAARQAANWLAGHQKDFANSNTAGLAAAALSTVRGSAAAAPSRAFIRSLQQGCATPFARRGAIAFDGTGFDATTAPRATAQAVLGLTGTNLATLRSTGSNDWGPTVSCS